MEALTRLYLVHAPVSACAPRPPARASAPGAADGLAREAAVEAVLGRLASRPLELVVSSPDPGARSLAARLAERRGIPLCVEDALFPGEACEDEPRRAAAEQALAAHHAGVILAVDRLAREHPRRELALVLHGEGARALLARAVGIAHSQALELEPGAIAALDWAHPEAREFQHSLVAVALDREVAAPPRSAHRYPGGASVLPGGR